MPADDLADWGDPPGRDREPSNVDYRLRRLEEEQRGVRNRIEDYLAVKQRLTQIEKEQGDITTEMAGLRRALYTAAISISGGAILFAATIFQVLGN